MTSAFSGHPLHNIPAQPTSTPGVINNGAMSFTHTPDSAFFSPSAMPNTSFGLSPFSDDSTTSKQIATFQAKLNKKLGPEYISQRPGPGGGPKLTYVEGWKVINLANEVFGFNGWCSNIVSIVTDFMDYSDETKRYNVGVTAIVRVTLRDGAYHEDVGYGMLENSKSKAAALDKCKKEAVTDALKRTLRNFGNLLGNCLYDKSYAQEVVKIKIPPAKFNRNELHRRPEFEERTSEASAPAPYGQASVPGTSSSTHEEPRIKAEHEGNQPQTPITHVPRHLRQEMAATAQKPRAQNPPCATTPHQRAQTHPPPPGSGSSRMATLANRGLPPVAPKPGGLATPIQTPAGVSAQCPPPPRSPPPRAVATSPLARVTSAAGRSVSFAEPTLIPAAGANTANVSDQQPRHQVDSAHIQGSVHVEGDDDDAFPLSTQEGLLFASIDLGDLGRPIDFEEGTSDVSMLDTTECAADLALEDPEHSRTSASPLPQLQKPTLPHTAKAVPPVCPRTGAPPGAGPPNVLKRSADAMQAGSSMRLPVQGMGLAQHQPIASTSSRHPPEGSTNDSLDSKRCKR